jgi:hypothetical protein
VKRSVTRAVAAKQPLDFLSQSGTIRAILLAELLDMDFDDDDFDAKFTAMIKAVQNHVEEEERTGGILDIARQKVSEERTSLTWRTISKS